MNFPCFSSKTELSVDDQRWKIDFFASHLETTKFLMNINHFRFERFLHFSSNFFSQQPCFWSWTWKQKSEWWLARFVCSKWTRLQKKRIVTIKIITSHLQSWNIDSQLLAIKCPLGSPKLIRKLDENIWHIRHDVYTTIVIGKINFVSHSTCFPFISLHLIFSVHIRNHWSS